MAGVWPCYSNRPPLFDPPSFLPPSSFPWCLLLPFFALLPLSLPPPLFSPFFPAQCCVDRTGDNHQQPPAANHPNQPIARVSQLQLTILTKGGGASWIQEEEGTAKEAHRREQHIHIYKATVPSKISTQALTPTRQNSPPFPATPSDAPKASTACNLHLQLPLERPQPPNT